MTRWRKLGLVFRPREHWPWASSHAQLPTPLALGHGRYRVFCAGRDERSRSHVGWFDIDLDRPDEILAASATPVLAPGPLGGFDDHGIYPASVVHNGSGVRLYTIGWNPGPRPPLFYASIGIAESDDDGASFPRRSRAPIMARSEHDPCLVTSPCVLREGDVWRMWYVSGYAWGEVDGVPQSHYHIKYATSDDGLIWRRDGHVALDHAHPGEKNIARACVLAAGDGYEAWYSFAVGDGYRIGFATSTDGLAWRRRDDEAGLTVSAEGWDSAAVAYPAVVCHCGRRVMFYNGNGFGRDGVGLAIEDTGE
jgi:hypothetical protein